MWTDAFLIYTSIYCTIHVLRLQELLKYMQTIRLGAKRNAGFRWKLYDEQFRLRKAQEPASSWAIIDTELWLLYMQPSAGAGNELGLQGAPRQTQNNKSFKCYAFNYNGVCAQQYCNFKHSCLKCSGVHPVISCTNNVQAVGNNPQSPGIAQRFHGHGLCRKRSRVFKHLHQDICKITPDFDLLEYLWDKSRTPIKINYLKELLADYQNKTDASILLSGVFLEGF